MYCTLITVGSLKEGYLKDACKEYEKRLSAYVKWDHVELKEEKLGSESQSEITRALEAEADAILAAIPAGAFVVALCVEGKQLSSEELAALLDQSKAKGGKICFIIGSSYGLSPRVKQKADFRLSVSRLTFPHQLMRVLLSETVYRSFTILAGKKYHK